MDIVIQYFDGCPNWRVARDRLCEVIGSEEVTLRFESVDTIEKAESVGFRGSPTILVDGVDPFGEANAPVGLSCRIYTTEAGNEGAPSVTQLRALFG